MASAMPSAFWVSVGLLALFACGASRSSATPASSVSAIRSAPSQSAGTEMQNTIQVRGQSGVSYSLLVDVDGNVAPRSAPTDVKVVGELEGTLLIVDTYNSIPGGMSYCQAGEESFLRVISTASATPEETVRLKLNSCRQNIELASPGLEWQSSSSTLLVQWLSGPAKPGAPVQLTLRFGTSNRARSN
jgi:hypothetical protein